MKIQHKKSGIADGGVAKKPTAAATEYGELCINYNHQDPSLFIRVNDKGTDADSIVKVGGDLDLYYTKDEINNLNWDTTIADGRYLRIDADSPDQTRVAGKTSFADNVLIGGTLPASPNITLNADGSATFAGFVDCVRDAPVGSSYFGAGPGGNKGKVYIVNEDDSDVAIRFYSDVNTGALTTNISSDGSATFAGNISGGGGWQSSPTEGGYRLHAGFGQLALSSDTSTDSQNFIQCQSSTGRAFQVATDGSATFAGKVTSASTASTDGGTTLVTKDYLTSTVGGGTGTFGYWSRTGTTLSPVNNDSVNIGSGKIALNANGNVSASRVDTSRDQASQYCFTAGFAGNTEKAWIAGNGYIYSSAGLQIAGNGGSQDPSVTGAKIALNADGSATFASSILSSGSIVASGPAAKLRYTNGQFDFVDIDDKVWINGADEKKDTRALQIGYGSGSTQQASCVINHDGSATFGGLTTHAGGVKVTGGDAGTQTIRGIGTNGHLSFYGSNSDEPAISVGNLSNAIRFGITSDGVLDDTRNIEFARYNVQPIKAPATYQIIYSANINSAPGPIDNFKAFNVDGGQRGNLNATNNYGFFSNIDVSTVPGSSAYNFYAAGGAPNFFQGQIFTKSTLVTSADFYNDGAAPNPTGATIAARGTTSKPGIAIYGDHAAGATVYGLTFAKYNDAGVSVSEKGKIQISQSNIIITGNTRAPLILDEGADARQVTSTEEITNASAVVEQLQPVKINGTRHGFTAAALQPLFAEAVTGTAGATEAIGTLTDWDGTELETDVVEPSAEELTYTEEVETDGVATMVTRTRIWNQTGTRDVYQGVDQTKLIPLLTKALQEALDKIETLETRLSDAGIA